MDVHIKVNVPVSAAGRFRQLGLGLQRQTVVPAAICSHDPYGDNRTKQNNQ